MFYVAKNELVKREKSIIQGEEITGGVMSTPRRQETGDGDCLQVEELALYRSTDNSPTGTDGGIWRPRQVVGRMRSFFFCCLHVLSKIRSKKQDYGCIR